MVIDSGIEGRKRTQLSSLVATRWSCLAVLMLIIMSLTPHAEAQPTNLSFSAPYREMIRNRVWCDAATYPASNCDINDTASASDGALGTEFRVTGAAVYADRPLFQQMDVGFSNVGAVGPMNSSNPAWVTVTYHTDGGSVHLDAVDGGSGSFAEISLWASVRHAACKCLISPIVDGGNPSVTLLSTRSGAQQVIPAQDIVLRFPLNNLPDGRLAADWIEVRAGLRAIGQLSGGSTGSVEGKLVGSLTSIRVDR